MPRKAYEDPSDADHRTEIEKIRKWIVGTDLPKLQSIVGFSKALSKTSFAETKLQQLRVWLTIARALTYLEKKAPKPFRGDMRKFLLLGSPNADIGKILSLAVMEVGQKFAPLKKPALMLKEELKRTTQKLEGAQNKTRAALDEFETMTKQIEPEGRTQFHIEWLRARWHVLSGQEDKALPFYEHAVDHANYRAGSQFGEIVEETLALAAHLGRKPVLNRLKNAAVVFGFLKQPGPGGLIQDWEIEHLKRRFHEMFPAQGRFKESISQSSQLPFKVVDSEKLHRMKPDVQKPDRVRSLPMLDGQIVRSPQLQIFVRIQNLSAVKQLLEAGAPVDQLNDSGESALLCAIQEAEDENGRQILDAILAKPHSPETLNSVTRRKRSSSLFAAIDLGDPDIVERLLDMGADPDLKGQVDGQSPLWFTINRMALVRDPEVLRRDLHRLRKANPDSTLKEVLRRYNVPWTGAFGDTDFLRSSLSNQDYLMVFEALLERVTKEYSKKYTMPKLLKVFELLLQAGADPNDDHAYPVPGRTPLMQAAENDLVDAYVLMLKHGGNPLLTDDAGSNCADIARGFRARGMLEHMANNGAV